MTNHADHPGRVLLKSFIWITNGPYHASPKISHPAHIVDQGKIRNTVEQAVDRDVPPQGILRRSTEAVCPNNISFLCLNLFEFRATSKGRDLDGLSALKEDMNQSKSAANDPAISEEAVDLLGMRIGGDIKVSWHLPQEEIPNTPPYQVSKEPMSVEAVENFQSLFIDHLSRDGMLRSRDDERS
jgi:hypothetical protein